MDVGSGRSCLGKERERKGEGLRAMMNTCMCRVLWGKGREGMRGVGGEGIKGRKDGRRGRIDSPPTFFLFWKQGGKDWLGCAVLCCTGLTI